jgi:hypothetical protein
MSQVLRFSTIYKEKFNLGFSYKKKPTKVGLNGISKKDII